MGLKADGQCGEDDSCSPLMEWRGIDPRNFRFASVVIYDASFFAVTISVARQ